MAFTGWQTPARRSDAHTVTAFPEAHSRSSMNGHSLVEPAAGSVYGRTTASEPQPQPQSASSDTSQPDVTATGSVQYHTAHAVATRDGGAEGSQCANGDDGDDGDNGDGMEGTGSVDLVGRLIAVLRQAVPGEGEELEGLSAVMNVVTSNPQPDVASQSSVDGAIGGGNRDKRGMESRMSETEGGEVSKEVRMVIGEEWVGRAAEVRQWLEGCEWRLQLLRHWQKEERENLGETPGGVRSGDGVEGAAAGGGEEEGAVVASAAVVFQWPCSQVLAWLNAAPEDIVNW